MIKLTIAGTTADVWVNVSHVIMVRRGAEGFGGATVEMTNGVLNAAEACEEIVSACRMHRR